MRRDVRWDGPWPAMVASTVLFAASYSLTKIALRDIPPFTLGLVRFALAGALLIVVGRAGSIPRRAELRTLTLAAALGITGYFALENLGVQLATATDASLLVAAYPVLAAILETVVTRRRPTARALAGMFLAGSGVAAVVIASGADATTGPHRLIGDLLLMASGLAWAGYTLVSRRRTATRPVLQAVAWQDTLGAALFLPLAATEAGAWRVPENVAAASISVAVLVGGCSIAAMALYNKALAHLSASTAVNALNLVPLWGVLIAATFLHERLTPLHLAGAAIVITGVYLTTGTPQQTAQQSSTGLNP